MEGWSPLPGKVRSLRQPALKSKPTGVYNLNRNIFEVLLIIPQYNFQQKHGTNLQNY